MTKVENAELATPVLDAPLGVSSLGKAVKHAELRARVVAAPQGVTFSG